MSLAAITNTTISPLANIQRNYQQVQGEFKTLGQDLSSSNLTRAQTDFVTLSQSLSGVLASNSSLAKALNSVGQALQSGDLAGAQQAFAGLPPIPIWTSVKQQFMAGHHAHPAGNASSIGGTQGSTFTQLLNQVGQALQSGNLSAAQQAFSALQATLPLASGAVSSATQSSVPQSTSRSVSVMA